MSAGMILYEQEYQEIKAILNRLLASVKVGCVVLIDITGQQIASQGNAELLGKIDMEFFLPTCPAVKEALAKGEEFIGLVQQVEDRPLFISIVMDRIILAVSLDSICRQALVKKYVSKCKKDLTAVFERIIVGIENERASIAGVPPDSSSGSGAPSSLPLVKHH